MNLYLIRHGEAVPETVDPSKPLSEEGRNDIQKVADHIKNMNISVQTIRHSGKKRAKETAEIIAQAVNSEEGIREVQGLAPNDDIHSIIDEVEISHNDLLLVGHLPYLGKLASQLVSGKEDADVIQFGAGTIVCLKKEDAKWNIEWAFSPQDN